MKAAPATSLNMKNLLKEGNKEGTQSYQAFYDNISKNVDITFVKVKGHSGDKYNDLADKLAKEALGI